MTTFLSILLGILFLGIIVLVHELGHFIAARLRKVDVEIFSIGLGPRIWGKNINGIDFRISAIPFGGYVKMKGDTPSDLNTEAPNTFYGTKPVNRILIAFAGPFFNYLFAVIVISIIFIVGFKTVGFLPKIYVDTSKGINYFSLAGIRSGDTIKSIDGIQIKTFQEIDLILIYKMDKNVEIEYIRDNKVYKTIVYIPKNYINNEGGLGISYAAEPVIGSIIKGSPSEQAGLKENDIILSIDGRKINFFNEIGEILSEVGNKEVNIEVLRDGKRMVIKVKPSYDEKNKRYVIGIVPKISSNEIVINEKKETNPLLAFYKSFNYANEKLVEVIKGIQLLITGKVDVQSSIAGPIRLTYFLSTAIENQIAFQNLLILVSIISMAIGIFNLIPFPGLDGWHIVLSSVEAITKKKPSSSIITIIETVGFVAIITLIILVLFNDIFNLLVRDLKIFR
ncbi:MAG: RIP metalloprotease RseP [Brevinematales bacterium]|nr:RIP metalloprotease RseP [Brevinematales bacterium]